MALMLHFRQLRMQVVQGLHSMVSMSVLERLYSALDQSLNQNQGQSQSQSLGPHRNLGPGSSSFALLQYRCPLQASLSPVVSQLGLVLIQVLPSLGQGQGSIGLQESWLLLVLIVSMSVLERLY